MSGSRDEGNATGFRPRHAPASHSAVATMTRYSPRLFVAQFLGLVGIVLYNWWVWVVVATNLLTSTNAFFSDLEATGRPDATLFQHLDLAAGVVMFVAFVVRGPWGPKGKRAEWRWLLLFAAAGAVGGHFAYACPEGLSAACRSAEWHLRLPAAPLPARRFRASSSSPRMTTAVFLAWKRTREHTGWVSRTIKVIASRGADRLSAARRRLPDGPLRRLRRADLLRLLLGDGGGRTAGADDDAPSNGRRSRQLIAGRRLVVDVSTISASPPSRSCRRRAADTSSSSAEATRAMSSPWVRAP